MSAAEHFSNKEGVAIAVRRAAANLVPPPDILPSEWAEENIVIPVGNAVPGPLRFANAPYQRGFVDVIKEPGINRVSYLTGAQLGKTTSLQAISAYFIAHEPRSQIFCCPTQGDVMTFMEAKLKPMIAANASIRNKMAKQRGREGVNNSRLISFIGGHLMMAWAGSTKTLRGRSAPVTHADEIDAFEATAEGNALELLDQRSATFSDQRLRTEASTPTIKGESNIEVSFEEGDKRRYYVPCPDCGEGQYLKWPNVRWDGRRSTGIKDFEQDIGQEHDPDSALYCCEFCGSLWNDAQRIAAIRDAEKKGYGWKAEKPFKGHASFHAPEMLSTFRRLRDIVRSYLNKIALQDMQSFVNVSLGEPYEEPGEKADPTSLLARCENSYPSGFIPWGGLFVTAGIDMQPDRLEVEIVAWGHAEQSWSIDYRVLWGDPLAGDVWNELDDLLAENFQHESGFRLPISSACLDSGGNDGYTQAAYDYAKGKTGRRLFAIKGIGGWGRAIVEKSLNKQSGKNARKVHLFLVGVDEAKKTTMRRLAVAQPGPGYCNFPADRDETYFKGLTCEKLVTKYVKGQPVRTWEKPDKARNEPLDCRNYAYAALKIINPSFKSIEERLKQQPPAQKQPVPPPPEPVEREPRPAEKPPEEAPAPANDNVAIIKAGRTLKKKSGKTGGWASKW